MSFSEDVVLAKFSTLTETQESIVGISQWVMFHRRHAAETADIWARALKKAPNNKKLALIYLANEVVQQSRAKKRDEFISAFANIIPGALGSAYKQCSNEIRAKIKRVVEVWRQRSIFTEGVLYKIEGQLHDVQPKKTVAFNSTLSLGDAFGDEIPPSLVKLSTCQKDLTKAIAVSAVSTSTAVKSYEELLEGNTLPAPQEYSEKLNILEPMITRASSNLEKTVGARKELLAQLQSLVASNETLLKEEHRTLEGLKAKIAKVLETKIEINDMLAESGQPNVEESAPTPPAPGGNFDQDTFMAPGPEVEQEYRPQPFMTDIEAPAYSPISSDSDSDEDPKEEKSTKAVNPGSKDSEESEPQAKKAKTEGFELEGLDPKVAQFLSNLVQGNT